MDGVIEKLFRTLHSDVSNVFKGWIKEYKLKITKLRVWQSCQTKSNIKI